MTQYIKKKIRVSKDQSNQRRTKDKNHFNKNAPFSFFRENASKFLASRYFRKGGREGCLAALATAGWHSWVYPILYYPILSYLYPICLNPFSTNNFFLNKNQRKFEL